MSDLSPIDFSEDIKNHEAFHETKTVTFGGCKHLNTKLKNQELKCQDCSAAWMGQRLHELQKLLNT